MAATSPSRSGCCRSIPVFLAGMNLVLLANDAFSFLVGWEFMSLASWALVVSQHHDAHNRRAGLVYLTMAFGGTLTLLMFFGVLAGAAGGYGFDADPRGAAARDDRLPPRCCSRSPARAPRPGSSRCTPGCRSPTPRRRPTSPR